MTTNYIVKWIQYGMMKGERFEFMTLAQMRMIQLESYGFKPVLIKLNINSGDNNCQV